MDGLSDWCKLRTVGPFDYYNVKYQMDDYPADNCAISPAAFLLLRWPMRYTTHNTVLCTEINDFFAHRNRKHD